MQVRQMLFMSFVLSLLSALPPEKARKKLKVLETEKDGKKEKEGRLANSSGIISLLMKPRLRVRKKQNILCPSREHRCPTRISPSCIT